MPITEIVTDLPTPPSSSDATNFLTRADAFVSSLDSFAAELNNFADQANTLETNVNAKEASATSSALTCTTSANFKGTWSGQTTVLGESWEYLGSIYRVLTAGNQSPNDAPSNWVRVSIASGRRNYLINGNFDSWQYGTSQTTSGYGSDNRWNNNNIGSTKTHSRVTCTDTERALFNASYFSRTVISSVAGASNATWTQQNIENITLLAGKTVTLSFWAKADASKNIAISLTQNFGTGGSPSSVVHVIGSQLVSLTTTWQKKTITITIPSIVGKTLGTDGVHTSSTNLKFWFESGSTNVTNEGLTGLIQQSGTFDIAQVKIEDGSVATDGWHPYDGEFGGEVQACHRYYEKLGFVDYGVQYEGYGLAGNTVSITTIYPTMRTIPTVAIVGTWNVTNCNQPTVSGLASMLQLKATTIATGQVIFRTTSTSGVTLSAEL